MAASPAAALSSVDLVWRGTGGLTTVTVSGLTPVTLVADLVLRIEVGAETLFGIGVSFLVDEDSANELNVVSVQENANVTVGPGNVFNPLLVGTTILESPLGGPALIEGFDEATLATGATPGTTLTLGSITFVTNQNNLASFDGPDVRVLVQLNGIDAIVDTSGTRCVGELPRNDCPYDFGELRVNAPEPTTSALLVAGLGIGLLYSRRR